MSDCPICFELIDDAHNAVITICRHKFHATCLFRTTQSGVYRCPNCRGSLLADGPTGATGSSAATGATGSAPATTGATGPMGTSGPIVYHGTGATASYYYQDISSNILHAMMSRTSVTYHNDSSDDESRVQGG